MINLKNTNPLTEDEIRSKAPSVFTEIGSPSTTSEKYCHISTSKVIEDMALLGWNVTDVKEVKARKDENKGYQKHLVIFRNDDIIINGEDNDTIYPQILLTNSHDGKNSFIFTAGLFRLVLGNGLVLSEQTFENMKLRHYGYTFEELQKIINQITEKLPLTVESLNKFKETILNQEQCVEFAKEAIKCRFSEEEINRIEIDYEDLFSPVRKEDEDMNLWNVFNVVQEKIINGKFNYNYGVKLRKARKIKNFKQDMVVNEKLYSLALNYC